MTAAEPQRPGGALPWAAFGLCCAVWSSTFLFIRIGNDTTPPVWAAGLRLAMGSVLLAVLARLTRQSFPRGAALRAALWFGFVDFGISLPLLYWGEQQVPSGVAAVMFATIPLSTAIFSRMAGLEALRPRTMVAALLGLGGVAVLASAQMAGHISPWALAAVFAAAVTAALAGVLLKRAPGSAPLAMNAVAHAIGAVVAIAVSRLMHERQALPASAAAWVPLAYLTIVGSVIAFAAFMYLVQHWPVTRTSFIALVIPVAALALGVAVRHEPISVASAGGSVVVLAAVGIALFGGGRGPSRA